MARDRTRATAAKFVTLRDVAALASVDASVVSRVLSGDPKLWITDATRQRVLDAVDKTNYQPNLMARGLRTSRSYTIGLLLPDIQNPVYAAIVKGAQGAAESAGYGLVLGSDVDQRSTEQAFAQMLRGGRVDGLLFSSGSMHDRDLRALVLDDAPIVVVNRLVDGVRDSIVVDDEAAARLATEHMLDLGHRAVVAVTGPKDVDTSVRRLEGFLLAARESGLRAPAVIHASAWDADAGYGAVKGLFADGPRVTAVIAMSLMLAVGILKGCRDAGLSVPDDVSVIGIHDNLLAEYVTPPLTTVALPLEELGSQAVRQLLRKLDGDVVGAQMVEIAPLLVCRSSTGPPR